MITIDINNISEYLENFEGLLIIGQPKGVGLTTRVLQFFSEKLFFEEDFNVLVLADNVRDKAMIIDLIKSFIKDHYDYETNFDYHKNYLKVFNNFFAVIDYKLKEVCTFEVTEGFKFNYSYVDKDDNNEILNYYLTDYLPSCSKKIIISTCDKDENIFYMEESSGVTKIIVNSKLSNENILKLSKLPEYTINYERLIKGQFDDDKIYK
jgi:hypothetical protein